MIKHIALLLILLLAGVTSCSDNADIDTQPGQVAAFIEHYFPGVGVSSSAREGDNYSVTLSSGEDIVFNSGYSWISIDGNGATLPQVFLFDCLPPALYEYLQETESVNSVYKVSRDSQDYTVALLNNNLVYNIESGKVSVPVSVLAFLN